MKKPKVRKPKVYTPIDYPPPPLKVSPLKEYVFPKVKGRPKVLMIADQKGWGAWKRGEYIQKLLSDEFELDLIDLRTFLDNFEDIKEKNYKVLYALLHILMRYGKVREMSEKIKTIATVTSRQILKPSFGHEMEARIKNFRIFTKHVNILIVNNLLVRPEAEKYFRGPVRYAPRGVDPDVFRFTKYPMDKQFTVFYVGKPVIEKGLKFYIKPACKRAGARLITNTRNFTNALSEEEMMLAYNNSNAYVVASIIDGTPNPALEAAACGRPIISNAIGNMPEFIEEGENGFLVPMEVSAYASKLKWMVNNREKAAAMGQRARETVLKGWTWDYILNKYQRHVLRELLN